MSIENLGRLFEPSKMKPSAKNLKKYGCIQKASKATQKNSMSGTVNDAAELTAILSYVMVGIYFEISPKSIVPKTVC